MTELVGYIYGSETREYFLLILIFLIDIHFSDFRNVEWKKALHVFSYLFNCCCPLQCLFDIALTEEFSVSSLVNVKTNNKFKGEVVGESTGLKPETIAFGMISR